MEMIKEKVERFKAKADLFYEEKIKAFIITTNGDWNFCEIVLLPGKNYLYVQHFAGKKPRGSKERIFYIDIIKFDEYKDNY